MDPAFDAHLGPFKAWALTVWCDWFPTEVLQAAIDKAKQKLKNAKGAMWAAAAGPVTAFLATAKGIEWKIESATTARDDLQRLWNFATDSPVAIADVVANSVRRWRLNKIVHIIPAAAPFLCDGANLQGPTQVIDFSRIVRSMTRGGGPGKKAEAEWDTKWAPDLASAINGSHR